MLKMNYSQQAWDLDSDCCSRDLNGFGLKPTGSPAREPLVLKLTAVRPIGPGQPR
jgi:hypothetical protein